MQIVGSVLNINTDMHADTHAYIWYFFYIKCIIGLFGKSEGIVYRETIGKGV